MIDVENARMLQNIKERLDKVEALIPHPQYATLVQSLRDDVRWLVALVDNLQEASSAQPVAAEEAPVPEGLIRDLIKYLEDLHPQPKSTAQEPA